ncbi:hypothetical protein [Aquibacillus albus]|uniref:Uncharacterized protein n=1 Tax=Aquibacillus albus TaxID=1168171 RepID=A0ABS2N443_9BACI|nr:hypothetical protein [Aquibacillus albus]MBM7572915.1 hypothetical protein [Aquibacillus albus]
MKKAFRKLPSIFVILTFGFLVAFTKNFSVFESNDTFGIGFHTIKYLVYSLMDTFKITLVLSTFYYLGKGIYVVYIKPLIKKVV